MAKRFDRDEWEYSLARINRILEESHRQPAGVLPPLQSDREGAKYPPYCNTGGYDDSQEISKLQNTVSSYDTQQS